VNVFNVLLLSAARSPVDTTFREIENLERNLIEATHLEKARMWPQDNIECHEDMGITTLAALREPELKAGGF
jgi:hypothetical protein